MPALRRSKARKTHRAHAGIPVEVQAPWATTSTECSISPQGSPAMKGPGRISLPSAVDIGLWQPHPCSTVWRWALRLPSCGWSNRVHYKFPRESLTKASGQARNANTGRGLQQLTQGVVLPTARLASHRIDVPSDAHRRTGRVAADRLLAMSLNDFSPRRIKRASLPLQVSLTNNPLAGLRLLVLNEFSSRWCRATVP